jgi:hypothetical protein
LNIRCHQPPKRLKTPSTQIWQSEIPTDVQNDPKFNLHQRTTEAVSVRRHPLGKTELCGRPTVSQIEVQQSNTEVSQSRARFNPQRKTAQYYQIVTPSCAMLYCYDTTEEGNKLKLPKHNSPTTTDANCSTPIATKRLRSVCRRQIPELTNIYQSTKEFGHFKISSTKLHHRSGTDSPG